MKTFLLCVAAVLMTACATTPGTRTAQTAWQAMNVIDMGQTLHIARSARTDEQMAAWAAKDFTVDRYCYQEVNPITRAIIGKHPSQKEAVISSALWAIGHAVATRWLDKRTEQAFATESPNRGAWYVGRISFHAFTLGTKAWQINHNNNFGIKPFGRGCKE
jgi:uncharacterized membrane protein